MLYGMRGEIGGVRRERTPTGGFDEMVRRRKAVSDSMVKHDRRAADASRWPGATWRRRRSGRGESGSLA
jgi:hypothetical protein